MQAKAIARKADATPGEAAQASQEKSNGLATSKDPDFIYTFAWDYPFSLVHQNTSVVLLSGKGSGPFSGPAGAASVASEFVKLSRPYRVAGPPATKKN